MLPLNAVISPSSQIDHQINPASGRKGATKIQGLRSQPRRNPSTQRPPGICSRYTIKIIPPTYVHNTSTHLILAASLCSPRRIVRHQLIADLHVQIPLILAIRLVLQDASDLLSLLYCQYLPQVEHCLLPVSVFRVRAGGEADGFVAGSEVDVEPGDQGVYEVVTAAVECEG